MCNLAESFYLIVSNGFRIEIFVSYACARVLSGRKLQELIWLRWPVRVWRKVTNVRDAWKLILKEARVLHGL
jgi:hypothetical protein